MLGNQKIHEPHFVASRFIVVVWIQPVISPRHAGMALLVISHSLLIIIYVEETVMFVSLVKVEVY